MQKINIEYILFLVANSRHSMYFPFWSEITLLSLPSASIPSQSLLSSVSMFHSCVGWTIFLHMLRSRLGCTIFPKSLLTTPVVLKLWGATPRGRAKGLKGGRSILSYRYKLNFVLQSRPIHHTERWHLNVWFSLQKTIKYLLVKYRFISIHILVNCKC
jgi:hypothetical protein